jgi:TRAP-type C4-dicarboxylate transport system permease small subunit
MKQSIRTIGSWLDKFNNAMELVAGLGAFTFMMLLCFQVMMRYVFSNPIFGIDEAVVALMVWICSLGWCTVYWQNGHAILEFIVKRLGPMTRRIIFHGTNLIVLVISVIFVPASMQLFKMQIMLKPVGGLPFNKAYYYALPVIVMSIIMLVYSVYKTLAYIVLDDERIVVPEPREEGNAID